MSFARLQDSSQAPDPDPWYVKEAKFSGYPKLLYFIPTGYASRGHHGYHKYRLRVELSPRPRFDVSIIDGGDPK
jgi:hypothetical protein